MIAGDAMNVTISILEREGDPIVQCRLAHLALVEESQPDLPNRSLFFAIVRARWPRVESKRDRKWS
jgi:hypothetical protein